MIDSQIKLGSFNIGKQKNTQKYKKQGNRI